MKIFDSKTFKKWEFETSVKKGCDIFGLVQRTAKSLCAGLIENYPNALNIVIFSGPGKNGADGILLAKELIHAGKVVTVLLIVDNDKRCAEWVKAYEEIRNVSDIRIIEVKNSEDVPEIESYDLLVDAIFGSGLSRPLKGIYKDAVTIINSKQSIPRVIALDIPSGLYCDKPNEKTDEIVRADLVLSIDQPKLSFFMEENFEYVKDFKIIRTGLDLEFYNLTKTSVEYVDYADIRKIFLSRPRKKGDHKGLFGKSMLVGGKTGVSGKYETNNDNSNTFSMIGAMILAAEAALRTGVGKLYVHVPNSARDIIHMRIPEAIVDLDSNPFIVSGLSNSLEFDSIGVGPGLGQKDDTVLFLHKLVQDYVFPIVFDADAINIIAKETESSNSNCLINFLPHNSILTPHAKEFERLLGKPVSSEWDRIKFAAEISKKHEIFIILKGAYTKIVTPDGRIYINSNGNRGMAKPGMGDVLTGLVTGFLAQGFNSLESALLGVFIHGLAGDISALAKGQIGMLASDVVFNIPIAIQQVQNYKKAV